MVFDQMRTKLVAKGYTTDTANAKIAHDVVLDAVREAGFHDNVTVKGGVVMSGLTNVVRRATMDMDVDFLHYSLSDTAIRRFVSRLNRISSCKIAISRPIKTLKQQEYKGKRVYVTVEDEIGSTIETKVDIGVHTRAEVEQAEFGFRVVTRGGTVQLLVNNKEQIFVEKLKSLLRFGSASTRFKDVFDMYYLSRRIRKTVLRTYMKLYIYDDAKMRECDSAGVVRRLQRIFTNHRYMEQLADPVYAWIDESPSDVTARLVDFLSGV